LKINLMHNIVNYSTIAWHVLSVIKVWIYKCYVVIIYGILFAIYRIQFPVI